VNNANRRVVNGINTVVLHGKDYIEVAERLRLLHELKKEFEVIESQPYQVLDRWVWRVVTLIDGKRYVGNAEVKMNAPKGTPDGTNPFECAETSAMGRALAWAGLGTVESIASYDEIARSQPFTAIIQPVQDRIVEASSGQQQERISSHASNGNKALPSPPQSLTEVAGNGTDLKARVTAIYRRAGKLNLFEPVPGDLAATQANFYKLVSELVGANITASGQITASRLELVEAYVNSKDSPVDVGASN
jgi:hypothetical protein